MWEARGPRRGNQTRARECAPQTHPETRNSIRDTPNRRLALLSALSAPADCSVQAISLDFPHPPNLSRNKSRFAARVKPIAFMQNRITEEDAHASSSV